MYYVSITYRTGQTETVEACNVECRTNGVVLIDHCNGAFTRIYPNEGHVEKFSVNFAQKACAPNETDVKANS